VLISQLLRMTTQIVALLNLAYFASHDFSGKFIKQ
jgi:hypothetical protein